MTQLNNPYAAPTGDADESVLVQPGLQVIPVSQGLRFANFIIDMIVQFVLNGIVGFVLGIVLVIVSGPNAVNSIGTLLSITIATIVSAAYYITMEYGMGQTVGKLITGTRVVDQHGNKPKLSTISIRWLVRNIPFEPFSFLISPTSGWHDVLSKTFVVKSR